MLVSIVVISTLLSIWSIAQHQSVATQLSVIERKTPLIYTDLVGQQVREYTAIQNANEQIKVNLNHD